MTQLEVIQILGRPREPGAFKMVKVNGSDARVYQCKWTLEGKEIEVNFNKDKDSVASKSSKGL